MTDTGYMYVGARVLEEEEDSEEVSGQGAPVYYRRSVPRVYRNLETEK